MTGFKIFKHPLVRENYFLRISDARELDEIANEDGSTLLLLNRTDVLRFIAEVERFKADLVPGSPYSREWREKAAVDVANGEQKTIDWSSPKPVPPRGGGEWRKLHARYKSSGPPSGSNRPAGRWDGLRGARDTSRYKHL